jgi:pyruvoyl-dependent arginine decarboxylase (PvlArgDC)
MLPWFQIGSAIAAALGVGGLAWYNSLPQEKREQADRMARDLAVEMFNKELGQLTPAEARRVHARLQHHFGN